MENTDVKQIDNLYKKIGAKKNCEVSKSLNAGTLQNRLVHSLNCKGNSQNPVMK